MLKNKKSFFYIVTFLILIFQEVVYKYIPIFKYYDELICIFIFLKFIIKIFQGKAKIHKYNLYILLFLIFILIIGITGNLLYKFQNITYILIDIVSCTRVFLLFIGLQYMELYSEDTEKTITIISKAIILIVFFFGIINIFFDINMNYDVRYGLKSYMFIYQNPGSLVTVLVLLISILEINHKKNTLYIALALISIIMTLRALGFAIVGAYIILKLFLTQKRKISVRTWIIIIVISILLGFNQINDYFFRNNDSPRNILLKTSVNVANDYFPTGTGFGTYGSDVTKKSYTQLYYNYKINLFYGLSKENSSYITDNYWPMIIAQFGWIGGTIFLIILYYMYRIIQNRSNKKNKISLYYIYAYTLASSIAAQLLAHSYGVASIIIMCFLFQLKDEKDTDNYM